MMQCIIDVLESRCDVRTSMKYDKIGRTYFARDLVKVEIRSQEVSQRPAPFGSLRQPEIVISTGDGKKSNPGTTYLMIVPALRHATVVSVVRVVIVAAELRIVRIKRLHSQWRPQDLIRDL